MNHPVPLSRREAMRRIFVASALASFLDVTAFGIEDGLGGDPSLLKKDAPWPRTMSEAEKRATAALADVLIPDDEHGPAASAVGIVDFLDEWVSAPYEPQQRDAKTLRAGLAWLDAEAQARFGKVFAEAAADQKTALVDDILRPGSDARKKGYAFWQLFRDRVAGGYYSTPEGWKALGYTGNQPQAEYAGPSVEALKHVGLA
jgi:hypothetical protein